MNKDQINENTFYPLISEDNIYKNNLLNISVNKGEMTNRYNKENFSCLEAEKNTNEVIKEKEREYLDENEEEFINKKIIDLSFLDTPINGPEENHNEINKNMNSKLNNTLEKQLDILNNYKSDNKLEDILNNKQLETKLISNNIYHNYNQRITYNNYNLIYQQVYNQNIINQSSLKTYTILKSSKIIEKKYLINIMDIRTNKEKRTTVRMLNIPSYYKPKDLAKKLDEKLDISPEKENRVYNFIYIPIKKNKNKEGFINAGFAFINFVHPKHILKFYSLFHGKHLKSKKSEKVCLITFASQQGIIIKKEDLEKTNNDKYIYFKDTKNHFQLLAD